MGTILKTINSNLPVQPNAFRIYCRVTTDMIVSKLNFMRITPTVHQACLRSYSINIEYYPKYMFVSTLYIYILLSYILFSHWRWRCNVETVWLLYFIVYVLVSQRITNYPKFTKYMTNVYIGMRTKLRNIQKIEDRGTV